MDNDLISRKALLAELKEWYNESKQREEANYEWETFESSGIESAMLCVENFPAVDAEPVRHGEWILNPCNLYNDATWVCSECGNEWVLMDGNPSENQMNYCPNCGAKMDGGMKTDVHND